MLRGVGGGGGDKGSEVNVLTLSGERGNISTALSACLSSLALLPVAFLFGFACSFF